MKRATASLFCVCLALGAWGARAGAQGPEPTPKGGCNPEDPKTWGVTGDTTPQDRFVLASFPCIFEPVGSPSPSFWSLDLNGDGQEDLAVLARSRKRVPDAWLTLPIHNPPYEYSSRGEIAENPMFQPKYSVREGETYLLVFHGGSRGWKDGSASQGFILQDVTEQPPEPTSFGNEAEGTTTPALKIRYEGTPGLLYWEGDHYVAVFKDE